MPIALVHPDGSLRKVMKSTLMNLSEKDVTSKQNLPSSQHPTVDAMAFIQICNIWGIVAEIRSHCYTHITTKQLHPSSLDF